MNETTHQAPEAAQAKAAAIETAWKTEARWSGITRDFSAEDVVALRGASSRSRRSRGEAPSVSGTW